jgi:YbbR domain-containing protein
MLPDKNEVFIRGQSDDINPGISSEYYISTDRRSTSDLFSILLDLKVGSSKCSQRLVDALCLMSSTLLLHNKS